MEYFIERYWHIPLLLALVVLLVLFIRAALIIAATQDIEYQRLRRKNPIKLQHHRNW